MMGSESGLMVFPGTGMRILSALIHYIGIAVLTHCLSRRIAVEDLASRQGLSQLTWPRVLVLLIFLDSWLFIFTSGVLIFGVGLEYSEGVCSAAILLCIGFYATSKILIYAFLIEKVHIVWSPPAGIPRFKSRVYIICFTTVTLYFAVILLLLLGRITYFREGDMTCVIGLEPKSSISLLTYDLYINVFLTTLFLWPLLRSKVVTPPVKRVATRTLVAAAVALTTSTVNIVVLTVLKGRELGWVCLGSCSTDVVVNALAIFWVTGGSGSKSMSTSGAARVFSNRERRPTSSKQPAPIMFGHPSMNGTPSGQQTPAFGYFPTTSLADLSPVDGARSVRVEGVETGRRPFHQPNNKFKSITGLFKKDPSHKGEQGVQITVTTEHDLEDPPTEVELDQERHLKQLTESA